MEDGAVRTREARASDIMILAAAGLEAMNWNGAARCTLEQFLATMRQQ